MIHPLPEMTMRTLLSASMACADPLEYRASCASLDDAGVDALHFDLCDGHFAHTFLLAPALLRSLRPLTQARFDAHLYCTHPSRYLAELRQAGTDVVVFHLEASEDAGTVVEQIEAAGMRAGLAILPGTEPPTGLAALLPALALVVVNMVGPAYSGQPFDPRGLGNARTISAMARDLGLELEIAADGHVSHEWLPDLLDSGCTHLVCGTSSIFKAGQDVGALLQSFRGLVRQAEENPRSQ